MSYGGSHGSFAAEGIADGIFFIDGAGRGFVGGADADGADADTTAIDGGGVTVGGGVLTTAGGKAAFAEVRARVKRKPANAPAISTNAITGKATLGDDGGGTYGGGGGTDAYGAT
jgi:hypothetical protein